MTYMRAHFIVPPCQMGLCFFSCYLQLYLLSVANQTELSRNCCIISRNRPQSNHINITWVVNCTGVLSCCRSLANAVCKVHCHCVVCLTRAFCKHGCANDNKPGITGVTESSSSCPARENAYMYADAFLNRTHCSQVQEALDHIKQVKEVYLAVISCHTCRCNLQTMTCMLQ